ncbi:MAG: hypothetical protein ACK4WB_05610, partial [Desulfatiglandales bacterium]
MKLILFGAGASYGSSKGKVPPLGAALFSELRRFDKDGWGALPSEIASKFEEDFELGMERLSQTRPHSMPILQRAMAKYFVQFTLREDSLYLQLAKLIKRSKWRGSITTLNYDLLLESSLVWEGIRIVQLRDPGLGEVELCWPHGCCNIFCNGVE